jgi:O-antigen ligase
MTDYEKSNTMEFEQDLDYCNGLEFSNVGKRDGWIAGFLLFALIFGPKAAPTSVLPPLRSADIVILVLMASRWIKSKRLYGKFIFSNRSRTFSWLMLGLALMLVVSTLLNIAAGRYGFFIKDFYQPIVFVRMIIIAAIIASLNFGEKQVKQFIASILIISIMSALLAFLQKFRYWYVSGLIERLYAIEWVRLETGGPSARVGGTFGNPNYFGLCLVLLAAVCLAAAINIKGLTRLFAITTYVSLSAAVLITTASRTAVIALFIITGISILLSMRGRSKIPALFITIIVIGIIFFVRTHLEDLPLSTRVMDIIGRPERARTINVSLHARYRMWHESLARAKENILWGEGIRKMYRQITDNGYIFTLLRVGIIGVSIYLSLLLFLFIRGVKALHIEKRPLERTMLLTSFIVLINHMIFEITGDFFWNVQYGAIFAAFMGLLCGLSRKVLDENYYQGEEYCDYTDANEITV